MKNFIGFARKITLSVLIALIATLPTHAGDKVTYYHNDAVGSPVAATNQLGQVIWRETYKPHGQRTTNAPASANNKVWFTGKQEESTLGISYFGARWYHPEAGRFLIFDPAGVSPENTHSFNRYAYANNNPYSHVDPSGGVVETAWDAFNIGLGVASFANNISRGSYGSAAVDAVGVAVDGAAAIVPFIPGGAGAAIKAGRSADDVVDAARGAKQTGSYTNTHESGNVYVGKGDQARSQESGRRIEGETGDRHIATDWSPAANSREAFKQESRRLDSHGGANSPTNYNKIESPGKKYRAKDGG